MKPDDPGSCAGTARRTSSRTAARMEATIVAIDTASNGDEAGTAAVSHGSAHPVAPTASLGVVAIPIARDPCLNWEQRRRTQNE